MKNTKILLNKKLVENTKIKSNKLAQNKKLIISELLSKNITDKQLNLLVNKTIAKNNPVTFIKYLKGTLLFKIINFIFSKIKVLLSNKWISFIIKQCLRIPILSLVLIRVLSYIFSGLTSVLISYQGFEVGFENLHQILSVIITYFKEVTNKLNILIQEITGEKVEEIIDEPKMESNYLEQLDTYLIPEQDLKTGENIKEDNTNSYGGYIFLAFILLTFGLLYGYNAIYTPENSTSVTEILKNNITYIKDTIFSWFETIRNEAANLTIHNPQVNPEANPEVKPNESLEETPNNASVESKLFILRNREIYKNLSRKVYKLVKDYDSIIDPDKFDKIKFSIDTREKAWRQSLKQLEAQYTNVLVQYHTFKEEQKEIKNSIRNHFGELNKSDESKLELQLVIHDSVIHDDLNKILECTLRLRKLLSEYKKID